MPFARDLAMCQTVETEMEDIALAARELRKWQRKD